MHLVRGGQYCWRGPNKSLGFLRQCGPEATVFRAPRRVRARTSRVLSSWNQQTGRDGLVDTIFEGLEEQTRLKITIELRRCIEVDINEAAKIGDLEKNSQAIKGVSPNVDKASFPNALIEEGVGELTLREGEEGVQRSFIDTTNAGDSRWRPPLEDEDWDAVCQAIYKGVEGAERENLYHKFLKMGQGSQRSSPKWETGPCGK